MQHLTVLSFRIWNSSAGIPSPPLVLFIVILSKTHLTSPYRISDSRCMITLWLSGSVRPFLYCSSICSCQLLIFSASASPYHLLPLLCPMLHVMFCWNLQLLERLPVFPSISLHCSLTKAQLLERLPVFPSISLHCSLTKAFLSLLTITWNSAFCWVYLCFILCLAFLFFSQLFVQHPQATNFPSCIAFSWGCVGLHLLSNVTNPHPLFFRYFVIQI